MFPFAEHPFWMTIRFSPRLLIPSQSTSFQQNIPLIPKDAMITNYNFSFRAVATK